MSIASHLFVGSPEEASRNDGLEGGPDERRAVFYRVMDTGLAPLFRIIVGQQCPSFEPKAMSDDFDVITFAFPVAFTNALAGFDNATFDDTVSKWISDPECPYGNTNDLRELLTALVRLAVTAKSDQYDLYLWNCI